ncbi:MAG: XrtA/PEP-CTERM system TPR-repeat protein PrsT [Thalassotalea sp.]
MKKLTIAILISGLFACSDKAPIDYLAAAKVHIAEQQPQAAIIELKNAILNSPELAEARFMLAKLYFEDHQFENAAKEFERALSYQYAKNEVLPLLAQTYHLIESDNALITLSTDAANLSPEQLGEIMFYQLLANFRLGKEIEGNKLINEVQQLPIQSVYSSLSLAYEALLAKDIITAKEQLNSILAVTPEQVDALKLLANIQLQEQDIDGAIITYRTYVKAYPDDLTIVFMFARLLTDANQTSEAEPYVDRLLKINSDHALLNQLKGLARYYAHDFQIALLHLEKSLLTNPTSVGTRLIAGVSAYQLKDYEKCQQHLSFIADEIPASHPALRLLAASQLALGFTLAANKTVESFDNLTNQDEALLSSLGLSLARQGEKIKAQALLDKANTLNGDSAQALPQLGLLKLSLNDASGIADLEKLLAKNNTGENITPNAAAIPNGENELTIEAILATAYLSNNQFDKAFNLANQLKAEDGNAIKGYILAGYTYIKQNEVKLARAEFEQALVIDPNNLAVKLNLIDLLPNKTEQEQRVISHRLLALLKTQTDYIPALSRYYIINKQLGDTQEVIRFVESLAKKSPENNRITLTLAKIYFNEKHYQKVITSLIKIENTGSQTNQYWQMLGQSYLALKDYTNAFDVFQRWLEQQPNNKYALMSNVTALEAQNKIAVALNLTEQYLAKQGRDIAIDIIHTGLLLKNKQFSQARRSYDNLPNEAYELAIVQGYLGQLQLSDFEYSNALPNLESAYTSNPSVTNALLVMTCLEKLNRKQQAFKFLSQHTIEQPTDIHALMQLALLQLSQDKNKAIISYKTVLQLNDNNALAHNNLAFLLAEKGDKTTALVHAKKAVEINPQQSAYLDTLGRILLDLNQNELALNYLTKAVEHLGEQKDDEVYLNYVEALIANKQIKLAQRKLSDYEFVNNTSARKALLEAQLTD